MLSRLLNAIDAFVRASREDPRAINLSFAEKEMEQDEEAVKAGKIMHQKEETYQEAIKYYGENSKQASSSLKELYEAKSKLDSLPSVKAYQQAYNELHFAYIEADDIIFGPFREKRRCHK